MGLPSGIRTREQSFRKLTVAKQDTVTKQVDSKRDNSMSDILLGFMNFINVAIIRPNFEK